ncbi:hypothetical protein [Clostridium luticellarii]|jgi:hypothetical protein|uniref:Uncharacterized protein n=1 Tax=Clostridium luticellarii TaxID=1691940 RepID=A0A2T0BRL9_9CLOT|nr:hypothetical protein [Clostridium luticellarii]MCI1943763.1 hypothetical protein [Clostridium luticellarii]MCI1967024.1 hypothetical protein [Clostridium luticellarii]MCI1994391.1 hypothetical protein [Clostridium luticellarii]MCI2038656.1 hypothetical protein [Clostridium luticellarii]PRR86531.1 hypothetical protein CLLU_03320 [Clostridium luticellarii]
MKIELELEEIKNIQNLIISRINELREKVSNDSDREEELKGIIRYYKKLLEKIENQI